MGTMIRYAAIIADGATIRQPNAKRRRVTGGALSETCRALGSFGDRAINPAHQVAQLLAGDLDWVLGVGLA